MAEPTNNPPAENSCVTCKLAFQNKNLYQNHLMSNKHQMTVHRAYINNVRETHSIYVTGLTNIEKKEEILEYFSEFGEIADYYLGNSNSFAFVQFRDVSVVEEMLKKKLTLKGKEIKVQKRKIRERHDLDYQKTTSDDTLKAIVLKLKDVDGVEKQLEELLKWLQPSQFENNKKYDCLCRDLQEALKKLFNVCVVYPFGSTVTGLDFAGSDVDAYVHVPDNSLKPNINMASIQVNQSRRHLEKNNRFSHLISIPKAKTPIVKCLHVPTQVHCDFNFKNMLGVCNSYLIRYYMNLDLKIKPMMVILKFWAKVHDLVGPTKFSSYSLMIMFIYFLQRFYHLPAVEVLQHANAPVNLQDRWNGGIDCNFRPVLTKLYCARMIDILVEFFDFCAKFEYTLYVIAPYLGCSIPRTHFSQPELLPKKYFLYCNNVKYKGPFHTNTVMCVQDPFEHTHNITRAVTPRILEEFVQLCKHGHEILMNSPSLYRLFIEETGEDKFQLKDGLCIFKINMPCNLGYMFVDKKTISNEEIRQLWYESINSFMETVLQKVFMSDVNISKKEIKGKAIKLDGQADVYDKKNIDCVKFNCIQRKNTWVRRKHILKDLNIDMNLNVLEKQAQVSNYISEVLYKDITFETSIFEFYLLMKCMINPTCMEFELGLTTEETKNKDFFTFARCFVMWIPQWYNQYHENQLNHWKKTTDTEENGKSKDETVAEIKTDALTKIQRT